MPLSEKKGTNQIGAKICLKQDDDLLKGKSTPGTQFTRYQAKTIEADSDAIV
jgi:hypothetical protein